VKRCNCCEGQCESSPCWVAMGRCSPSPQAFRHTSPPGRVPQQYSVPQPQAALQLLNLTSAPPRRHCQRPKLVKGRSPQGSRVAVQIEQYLLRSAEQLASCSSPAATASRFTSSMLPHVSLLCRRRKPTVDSCVDNTAKLRPQASVLTLRAAGANQLLKPASTTPRSYGRRHRSWHRGHIHAKHNERCHVHRPVHHDQLHAWRRGHHFFFAFRLVLPENNLHATGGFAWKLPL